MPRAHPPHRRRCRGPADRLRERAGDRAGRPRHGPFASGRRLGGGAGVKAPGEKARKLVGTRWLGQRTVAGAMKNPPARSGGFRVFRSRQPNGRGHGAWAQLPPCFFSAAPRISPSDAPESVEPYCATASFSSAISSALIDTVTLRVFLSKAVTR